MSESDYLPRQNSIPSVNIRELFTSDMTAYISERMTLMTDPSDGGRNAMRRIKIRGMGEMGVEELCTRLIYHLMRLAHFTSVKTKLSFWESWNLVIDLLGCHSENPDRNERLKFVKRAYGALAVNQAIQIIQEVKQ